MLRAVAIFLATVHLINIIGSYGIISRLESIHQNELADNLDQDHFSGSDAITLRVPFSLPYSSHSEHYERATGKIEYDNEVYYMVKHKFHNDTLYIVCVKDIKFAEINNAYNELAASMSDKPGEKSQNKTGTFQVKDFDTVGSTSLDISLFQLEVLRLPDYWFSLKMCSSSPLHQPPNA
jgi:hypothetical protein